MYYLICLTQRSKNRDFGINTMFYMIFLEIELNLINSDEQ